MASTSSSALQRPGRRASISSWQAAKTACTESRAVYVDSGTPAAAAC